LDEFHKEVICVHPFFSSLCAHTNIWSALLVYSVQADITAYTGEGNSVKVSE